MAALWPLAEATGYATAYVVAVYAFPTTRTTDPAARDSTAVVWRRCLSISVLSGACLCLTAARRGVPVSHVVNGMMMGETTAAVAAFLPPSQRLGALLSETAVATWRGLAVTATLFAGVIVNRVLDECRIALCDALDDVNRHAAAEREARRRAGDPLARAVLPSATVWLTCVTKALALRPLRLIWDSVGKPEQLAPTLRTLVVAPITEEICIRYMALDALERAVLVASGGRAAGIVLTRMHRKAFVSPALAAATKVGRLAEPSWTFHLIATPARRMAWSAVVFALSHAHHGLRYYQARLEYLRTCRKPPSSPASPAALAQYEADLSYEARAYALGCVFAHSIVTATFGLLSSWILLARADGSVVAPLAAHMLCNAFGAPSLAFLTEDRATLEAGGGRGGRIVPRAVVAAERVGIAAAHALGIAGFGAAVLGYW